MSKSSLSYADYNFEEVGYIPPPKPSLNGGLYTGKPFDNNAPWRNFPVTPDAAVYTHLNLRSAKPTPEACYQYPGQTRPGNNYLQTPGVGPMSTENPLPCIRLDPKDVPAANDYMQTCNYSKPL